MAAEVPEMLSRWFWSAVIGALLWAPVALERLIDPPIDLAAKR